jgi:hypothetical protein
MLFSQRYFRAIENDALVVEIPDAARRKLWAWLSANNASLGIQRDPNNSWISNSSVVRHPDRCGFSEFSDYEASRTIPGTRNAAACQEGAVFVGR